MDESKLAYDRSVTALTGAGREFELTRCSIDNRMAQHIRCYYINWRLGSTDQQLGYWAGSFVRSAR